MKQAGTKIVFALTRSEAPISECFNLSLFVTSFSFIIGLSSVMTRSGFTSIAGITAMIAEVKCTFLPSRDVLKDISGAKEHD